MAVQHGPPTFTPTGILSAEEVIPNVRVLIEIGFDRAVNAIPGNPVFDGTGVKIVGVLFDVHDSPLG